MSTHYPTFGRLSGLGSVLKSFTKLRRATQAPIRINPKVVGGGPDQQALFTQLQTGLPSERAEAAKRVSELLEKFAISLIPELWYAARDLADVKTSNSNVRRLIITLLYRCVQHDHTLTTLVRLVYFLDVVKYCKWDQNDPEALTFIATVKALTNDGREVYDLVMNSGDTNLVEWIIKGIRLAHEDNNVIVELMKLVSRCLEKNASLLGDFTVPLINAVTDVENVHLDRMLQQESSTSLFNGNESGLQNVTSRLTMSTSNSRAIPYLSTNSSAKSSAVSEKLPDFEKLSVSSTKIDNLTSSSLELIYTVVIFGQLPTESYSRAAELLCLYHTSVESQDCIKSLASSEPFVIVPLLCEIINVHPRENKKRILMALGALVFLMKILQIPNIEVQIRMILEAFLNVVDYKIPEITSMVLKIWLELIQFTDLPFTVWYSPTVTGFNIISKITPTTQDDVDNLKVILTSLQTKYISRDISMPKEQLVQMLFDQSLYISNDNIQFILDYYNDERLCYTTCPFYEENIRKVLHLFYAKMPLAVLKVLRTAYMGSLETCDTTVKVFKQTLGETNPQVLEYLLEMLVESKEFSEISQCYFLGFLKSSVEFQKMFAETAGKIFILLLVNQPDLSKIAYDTLLKLLSKGETLAIPSLRVLMRLRCTYEGFVYATNPLDMDGLSLAFGRNINNELYVPNSEHKWVYPEHLSCIPETHFDKVSSSLVEEHIDISAYFTEIIRLLREFVSWEVYSFIWAHFCPQLANRALFVACSDYVVEFHRLACDQLALNLPPLFNAPQGYTKLDIQVAIVRTYSALLSYHALFLKKDEDLLVNSLILGLSSWEKTAVPCIHIITVCCYEIPLSIKKFLSAILTTLQTRVSSPLAAAPILELLALFIHLDLTANFTLDEFRRVFAIAFKYAQQSKERTPTDPQTSIQVHGMDAIIDVRPLTATLNSSVQYVRELSLWVISMWFLKLSMSERRQLSLFLMKNLVSGEVKPDNEILSFIDFIARFTYSDLPLEITPPPQSESSQWIVGKSIISISTDGYKGESDIVVRRASGVTQLSVSIQSSCFPSANQLLLPQHLLLQLSASTSDLGGVNKPIPMTSDPSTSRAISSLDRVPTVELHKVGLMYIGANQSDEISILSNLGGSTAYQEFLTNIGDLIRLQNCKLAYVGGLDTSSNTDGPYAISYRTTTCHLIFHTTLLMPNVAADKQRAFKKRHIGNNYVNIFFDESGLPFNFNIIRLQFNFFNIVIQPHLVGTVNTATYYRVKVFRRHGVPGIFATSHFKLILSKSLPEFVRNLSFLANLFATVWNANGEYILNWAHRLNQIDSVTQKTLATHKTLQEQNHSPDTSSAYNTTQLFLQQLRKPDAVPVTAEMRYEYVGDDDNELYKKFEFNSYA